jgi:hypothetical protein
VGENCWGGIAVVCLAPQKIILPLIFLLKVFFRYVVIDLDFEWSQFESAGAS